LIIGFQDTVENVGDVFLGTECTCRMKFRYTIECTKQNDPHCVVNTQALKGKKTKIKQSSRYYPFYGSSPPLLALWVSKT